MWHIFWQIAAWIGLCVMVFFSVVNLISMFKSTYDFSESAFGLLFSLLLAFLCYKSLFPGESVEVKSSAYTASGTSLRTDWGLNGDSRPKTAPNELQVEDLEPSNGFGNDGVSGYDSPSYGKVQETEPISSPLITPIQSFEEDTLIAHYFYPQGEGNGYFEIKPGDRVETVAGDKINMDIDIPFDDSLNVTVNDEQVKIMPAATNPNVFWCSFIAEVGDNEVKVSVSGSTYGFIFIGT